MSGDKAVCCVRGCGKQLTAEDARRLDQLAPIGFPTCAECRRIAEAAGVTIGEKHRDSDIARARAKEPIAVIADVRRDERARLLARLGDEDVVEAASNAAFNVYAVANYSVNLHEQTRAALARVRALLEKP